MHGEDDHGVGILLCNFVKMGKLIFARRTSSGPEINDDYLTLVVVYVYGCSNRNELKICRYATVSNLISSVIFGLTAGKQCRREQCENQYYG
jgi:hypothetical protein